MTQITGRKGGGGSPRAPVEQPDDLQSVAKAKLLIALGEGEFAGELTGKNIFLDGTPLLNADGSENFPGVVWEYRSGTQAQTYIQGMPAAENEITVGTTVQSSTPWAHAFTNPQLSAVRVRLKWPSLFRQEDNGDMVGNEVKYAIDLQTDGGSWKTVVDGRVKGKTTSGYERTHRIDLPQSATSWTLRVRKITEDANSAKIGDTMVLQSYTEVIDAKLTYPHTALLYIEFDSKQFNGSIPQVTCEPKMRVIRIPSNYDPEHRAYSGTWDGSFKWAWTNNPAWIFYDIVVSDRFGLGDRIKMQNIDKWELYRVAQYCDQPVPDGKGGGGTEPRYICDVYVQDRNEAYTVLRDFAAIFRGMTYWGGNQIITLADMPRDIDYSYTKANVLDGRFTYSGSSSKARYSSALVSYSDPLNGYADAMEPVFENELVYRFGFNQLEMTAIGCTRQSEANRKGRWGILTNNKDRVVTFKVGLDGNIPQPGYIIAVADENLSGKVTGGRVSAVNGRSITLDRKPDAAPGDRLMLNLPSGKSQARTIQMVTDNVITVTTEYSETPEPECVWVTESDELYAQQYRVVSVTENDDGTFTISAAMHDPDKYDRIDTGAVLDERPVSVIPPGNQFPPKDITISSYSVVNQGISIETMQVTWSPAENAIAYEAQWRRDDGNWINVPRNATTSFDVPGVYSGRYLVRVRAINAAEISSGWGYSEETRLTGKVGDPPMPLNFRASTLVFGIKLNWEFGKFTEDTLKTEIQYSKTNDGQNLLLLADVPYPSRSHELAGLAAGTEFYFRARLVDKSGNYSAWTDYVRGISEFDAGEILADLSGKIGHDQLAQDLLTEINSKADSSVVSALDERMSDIGGEVTEATSQVQALSGKLDKVKADLTESVVVDLDLSALNENTYYPVILPLTTSRRYYFRVFRTLGQYGDNKPGYATHGSGGFAMIVEWQVSGSGWGTQSENRIIDNVDWRWTNQSPVMGPAQLTHSSVEYVYLRGGAKYQLTRHKSVSHRIVTDTYTGNGQSVTPKGFVAGEIPVSGEQRFNATANAVNRLETSVTEVSGRVTSTAQQVTRLESQVGADSAKIEQTSKVLTDLNGRISASWTMKVQLDSKGNKVITGIGLGFNAQGNSQFLVNAQNFAVISSLNGKVVTPFVIQNGQAFFNDALISQATIDKLLVGNHIRSVNYETGRNGYFLNAQTGNAEFNNGVFRGTLDGVDGRFTGTVYAERLVGDVAVAASYPQASAQNTHGGGGGWTTATSVITYAGGMLYDMTLVLPSITAIIEDNSGSNPRPVSGELRFSIRVDGVGQQATSQWSGQSVMGSAHAVIPRGRKNVKIEIEVGVRHKGRAHVVLREGVVMAFKRSSASFR